jgi:hypothetical protein
MSELEISDTKRAIIAELLSIAELTHLWLTSHSWLTCQMICTRVERLLCSLDAPQHGPFTMSDADIVEMLAKLKHWAKLR